MVQMGFMIANWYFDAFVNITKHNHSKYLNLVDNPAIGWTSQSWDFASRWSPAKRALPAMLTHGR